ncbi:uncharacterized protein ACOB8E_009749 [Sarcophilus harrisii]
MLAPARLFAPLASRGSCARAQRGGGQAGVSKGEGCSPAGDASWRLCNENRRGRPRQSPWRRALSPEPGPARAESRGAWGAVGARRRGGGGGRGSCCSVRSGGRHTEAEDCAAPRRPCPRPRPPRHDCGKPSGTLAIASGREAGFSPSVLRLLPPCPCPPAFPKKTENRWSSIAELLTSCLHTLLPCEAKQQVFPGTLFQVTATFRRFQVSRGSSFTLFKDSPPIHSCERYQDHICLIEGLWFTENIFKMDTSSGLQLDHGDVSS